MPSAIKAQLPRAIYYLSSVPSFPQSDLSTPPSVQQVCKCAILFDASRLLYMPFPLPYGPFLPFPLPFCPHLQISWSTSSSRKCYLSQVTQVRLNWPLFCFLSSLQPVVVSVVSVLLPYFHACLPHWFLTIWMGWTMSYLSLRSGVRKEETRL